MKAAIILFCALFLASCRSDAPVESEVEVSRNFVELLLSRDIDAIETIIEPYPSIPSPHYSRSKLKELLNLFPDEPPIDVQHVRTFRLSPFGERSQINVDFFCKYSSKSMLLSVHLLQRDETSKDAYFVSGFDVLPLPDDIEAQNHFSLDEKGYLHYFFLCLAISVPAFIVFALVICVGTPNLARKWLWLLFILLGVGEITLNWTDGVVVANPIAIRFLGVGYQRIGTFSPWLISVSLPLGAVIFLLKHAARKSPLRKRPKAKSLP